MSHSQEIEKLFDADNGENMDENIEEIELEIETITEEDYKFFEHYFYLVGRTEIDYRLGSLSTDLICN